MTSAARVRLFGHSAGRQFAHSLIPHDMLEAVIAANPGWYTLPTLERRFPEGLGGLGFDESRLAAIFAYPLVVLTGEEDNVCDDPHLPKQDEALRQGPYRFARAQNYSSLAGAKPNGSAFPSPGESCPCRILGMTAGRCRRLRPVSGSEANCQAGVCSKRSRVSGPPEGSPARNGETRVIDFRIKKKNFTHMDISEKIIIKTPTKTEGARMIHAGRSHTDAILPRY